MTTIMGLGIEGMIITMGIGGGILVIIMTLVRWFCLGC